MRAPRNVEITLDSNVNFAPDMRVNLYNEENSLFGTTQKLIGAFLVPVASITRLYTYP
jgi:hypothetical protein